jgi:hypothetical protein
MTGLMLAGLKALNRKVDTIRRKEGRSTEPVPRRNEDEATDGGGLVMLKPGYIPG